MSWTDNNNYNQILINSGLNTPITSFQNQNKNIVQELNSKLLNNNSSQLFGSQLGANSGFNQIPVNYSAPSTVSSVSSESTGEFNRTTTPKSSNMGTQIDNYFANENSRVSSNFWNLNDYNSNKNLDDSQLKTNILQSEVQFKNTTEEETFLQNQANQSLNNDLWNTNYQLQNNNNLNNSSSDINHSNSNQSLFDLMKYGYSGFNANSNNQNYIPNNGMNNTQFSNNNNNSNQIHGLSYTASTTPLPSTPLSNTSPEQMSNNLSTQFQIQQDLVQQQQQQQAQPQQSCSNNTQNLLQNYQQQQQYLEQLQQQHNQLIQNPLFIQQQAQLVSQQLQQLQLQLQIQKQQIESNNLHLLNLQQKDPQSLDKLPLTEENLIKLQQSPKIPNSDTKANSTTNSSGLGENKSSVNTELYKTELCSTFTKTGSCPYGNKCQFAHGENELKLVNRGSKYRSKPCANWSKTGACRYGNRCCFRHGN